MHPISVREFSVPLRIKNLKDSLVATNKPKFITIIAEGYESDIEQLHPEFIGASVNLEKAEVGEKFYPIHLQSKIETNLNLKLKCRTQNIKVENLKKVTKDIVIEESGSVAKQLIYEGSHVKPSKVTISGPESYIDKISKVRALLNLSALNSSETSPALVDVLDASNNNITHLTVEPNIVQIHPAVAYAPATKQVPISIQWKGQLPLGRRLVNYKVQPSAIKITGSSTSVSSVYTVNTTPIDLSHIYTSREVVVDLIVPEEVSATIRQDIKVTLYLE